jgi:ABC-type nitrate/sulfonate/bicarbonate transport system substrate-binding protein
MTKTPTLLGAIAAFCVLANVPVYAQQKFKVAYLRADQLVAHWHAEKLGLFKKEGMEFEIVSVNNGPAVASAVASGSVDFGWSGSVPIVYARAQNQPFKVFMTPGVESSDNWATYIVASGNSGVKSIADLKGKTFVMNAVGAVCELQMRSHFKKVGLKFDDVKTLIAPFPQMAPNLELGNGVAACPIEPFLTQMRLGGKINPVILARGYIPEIEEKKIRLPANGYFATEQWLAKNPKIVDSFMRAIIASTNDLLTDLNKYRSYLISEFKMPKDQADAVDIFINRGSQDAIAADWQVLIDAMVDSDMLKQRMNAAELIYSNRK